MSAMLNEPDVVVVISDGEVYNVFVRNGVNPTGYEVIDLDTGDIADDREYEWLMDSDDYILLDGE